MQYVFLFIVFYATRPDNQEEPDFPFFRTNFRACKRRANFSSNYADFPSTSKNQGSLRNHQREAGYSFTRYLRRERVIEIPLQDQFYPTIAASRAECSTYVCVLICSGQEGSKEEDSQQVSSSLVSLGVEALAWIDRLGISKSQAKYSNLRHLRTTFPVERER